MNRSVNFSEKIVTQNASSVLTYFVAHQKIIYSHNLLAPLTVRCSSHPPQIQL